MIIKSLLLNNFRNYENTRVFFSNEFNYIFGKNGAGKTNILEAMSFLSYGKSFLNSKETDCILFGRDNFFIEGHYQNELANEYSLSVFYNGDRKSFSLNKERINGFASNVFGKFPLVYLTPQCLNITYGNPSERRKFFDIIFSQINRVYLDYLKELNKILKLKNTLLKETYIKTTETEFNKILESYNELMTEVSSEIVYRRQYFLLEFEKYLEKNYKYLTTEDEIPEIVYYSSITGKPKINIDSDKEKIKNEIKDKLDFIKYEEISRKITLIGPHRDDYIFQLKRPLIKSNKSIKENDYQPFEIKSFASQGEHKTYLIALKLSEYNFIKDKIGINPILVLDDVLSELDAFRVNKIITYIPNFSQVFITSTDSGYIEELKNHLNKTDIKIFHVENNNIRLIN